MNNCKNNFTKNSKANRNGIHKDRSKESNVNMEISIYYFQVSKVRFNRIWSLFCKTKLSISITIPGNNKLRFRSGVERYYPKYNNKCRTIHLFIHRITKTVTILCTTWKRYNTLFPSSSFVIEIASPVPDETSMQAAEGPARNGGGHPAGPELFL